MADRMSETAQLFSVDGLVAVVTGGGTGIGLMIATALENNGAIVYIVSKQLAVLEKAAKENNRHGNMIPIQCDITNRESLLRLAETVKSRHGFINLLVNNAGIVHNVLPKLPTPADADIAALQQVLWDSGTPEDFSRTFDVNTSAAYYCTVCFLQLLDAGNKRGNMKGVTSQVITVSSGGGYRKDDGVFSISYTLSKAAATHLGKMLANFLKDWQIRSNVIGPGIFPSRMTDGVVTQEHVRNGVPLQREGTIDDIGGLVLFLASKAGSYVNGTVHLIDGGRLMLFPSTY